jgi:hypothetical protein
VLLGVSATAAQAQTSPAQVLDSFGMQFESNVGQVASDATFLARGPGYSVMLTPRGGVVRSHGGREMHVAFVDGQATAPAGEAATRSVVNYFAGSDRSRWRTNVATFARVRYPDVYPGVDVVYYGTHGQMEYDIEVAAGADPTRIRMRFEGADRVSIDSDGNLAIALGDDVLMLKKPVLHQDDPAGRRSLDGKFVRFSNGEIGVAVAAGYDPRARLVIDPVLVYSTFLPTRMDASMNPHLPSAIAVGPDGAVYIVGRISTPFAGVPQDDVFVAKINPSGSALVFITYLGGVASEAPTAVALGPSGEIFLAGGTSSFDFPLAAATQASYGGQGDAFLAKLSPTGDTLELGTYAGGAGADAAQALLVDSSSNAYLIGTTSSTDFPLLSSPRTFGGSSDAFVAKYDGAGARVFSIVVGGTSIDEAHAAHLLSDSALLIAGETLSTNFPTTPGAYKLSATSQDGFVARLDTSDGQILQATLLGGGSFDQINSVTADASGAVYVTGETFSSDFPTTAGVVQPTYSPPQGLTDAFVTKLASDLSGLVYSTYLAGNDVDRGRSIGVDALGQVVVSGTTQSANFVQFAPLYPSSTFSLGAFVTKLSANGKQFLYSTFFPGVSAMAVEPSGDAYIAGNTSSATYPTTSDALLSAPSVSLFSNRGVFARISDATPACSFQVHPSVLVISGGSSTTQGVSVVAPSECFWTASSDDTSWLNPTVTSGAGIGFVTFNASNLIQGVRSATITVGNGTVQQSMTVYQRACFVGSSSVPAQPITGGQVTVSLGGPAGCPWAFSTDASWLTATPTFDVLDGTGQGQATLTIAPNPANASRSATVYFSDTSHGSPVQVTQAGHCTASLSLTSFTSPRTGGIVSMTVTATPADCVWTAKADALWLVPSVASGVGSQTMTVTALANTSGSRVGRLVIAGQTVTVTQQGFAFGSTPSVFAPSPAAGSGFDQTFTFLDNNGATNLDVVNVLINDFLDGGSACYLAYARSINVLYLVNDPGNALLPGLVLNGGAQTVGNSQCQIDGSGSSALVTGNVLELTLKLTFSPQFAGNKVVYQAARNLTGFNSGWVQQGVWQVPDQASAPLEVVSMTPARGGGTGFPFQFTFRDVAGADHLVSTSILINGYLDGFRGCYLGYHVPSNSVLLLNDAGEGYLGSVVLGTNTTIENSQCRIRAVSSGVQTNGTDLTLTLMIEFKSQLAGERVFYLSAQDDVGTSGWQAVGSWTAP